MGEVTSIVDNKDVLDVVNPDIPGTAKIRKIGSIMTSMELLKLAETLAKEGLYKKLWSVLSRVYQDKKGFDKVYDEEMRGLVENILASGAPSELKLQTFTSFALSERLLPDEATIKQLIETCDKKRYNIAAFFIEDYSLELKLYDLIKDNKVIFTNIIRILPIDRLIDFYSYIFSNENKETITGDIRALGKEKRPYRYNDFDKIMALTNQVFEAKEVFFTSKLLFCTTFHVPEKCVKSQKDLNKILRISINYEEAITKDFIKAYNLDFKHDNEAMCKYYIGNKKSQNQKALVHKFASHIVGVEDEIAKKSLLHAAFKRGGYFRMYAGCMQDGYVDREKMLKRFHYSESDIDWCSLLPGLKK